MSVPGQQDVVGLVSEPDNQGTAGHRDMSTRLFDSVMDINDFFFLRGGGSILFRTKLS